MEHPKRYFQQQSNHPMMESGGLIVTAYNSHSDSFLRYHGNRLAQWTVLGGAASSGQVRLEIG